MNTAQQHGQQSPSALVQGQALPSITSLTGTLPQPDRSPGQQQQYASTRDSGNWSISQSKHSSSASNVTGLQLQTILNAEDSPSRVQVPNTPQGVPFAVNQTSALPSLNRGFDQYNRPSIDTGSYLDSRRSSIDSRVNTGMNSLAISPSSPYQSQNASRVSLAASLQQQRGMPPEQRTNGTIPLSPLNSRSGPRIHTPRRAPVIHPNPRSVTGMPNPTAAAPTKGFAWAFPDDSRIDERRGSSSGESSVEHSLPSRQNSFATSINSSIYTTDSALPAGQRRFDDDIAHTHHHSLQHRTVANLQGEQTTPTGTGNYSRTPELRVSHKMAERKRRSEMKSLFDELNGILPNSPGAKSSKWEILTKSIEHIRTLSRREANLAREMEQLRGEAEYARKAQEENNLLRNEVHAMWQHLRRVEPNNPHIYGHLTNTLAHEQSQAPNNVSNMLPPLQPPPTQWPVPPPPPAAMQGVEYAPGQHYDRR